MKIKHTRDFYVTWLKRNYIALSDLRSWINFRDGRQTLKRDYDVIPYLIENRYSVEYIKHLYNTKGA